MESRIKELVASIQEASDKYYNSPWDTQLSDENFDKMVEELRKIDHSNPILHQVGWGAKTSDNFYPHRLPVVGLPDYKWENVDDSHYDGVDIMMDKLDGLTWVAYYFSGHLSKVLTRGDGKSGKDITAACIAAGVARTVNKNIVSVRGEAVLSYANFEAGASHNLWKQDTHPRNVAAGIITSNDTERAKFIDLVVFDVVFDSDEMNNKLLKEKLELVRPFYKIVNYYAGDAKINKESAEKWWDLRTITHYPLDGLVLFNEATKYKSKLKFPADEIVEMEVHSIEANVRRTGKVSFRVWFKNPCFVSGCWIRKATGNNLQWLLDRKIGQKSVVRVKRANEVIPNILDEMAVIPSELRYPKVCPHCNTPFVQYKSDLMCQNEECPTKVYEVSYRFFSNFAPKGMGSDMIEELLDWINLRSSDSIQSCIQFAIDYKNGEITPAMVFNTEFRQGMLSKMMENLLTGDVFVTTILWVLNMRTWGEKKRNKYSEIFYDIKYNEDHPEWTFRKEYLPESRHSEWNALYKFFENQIKEPKKEVEVPVSQDAIRFSMTGALNGMKKSDLAMKVIGKGVWDDKNPEILVTDSERESAKMKKAKEAGIEVISSSEFLSRLGF